MMKIILDTNFLISIVDFKIDFIEELQRICNFPYEICMIDKSLGELEKISVPEQTKKLVKDYIIRYDINMISTGKKDYVDDLILDIISPENYLVATQDKELKKKIKIKGVQTITIRQKNYLQIER